MADHAPEELVIAGTGDLHIAPHGTALPVTPTATLNGAFKTLGLTTEDGAKLTWTPKVEEFNAWQSRSAVRRELTGQELQLETSLEQWNETNFALAFGGGQVTQPSPGIFRYDFLDDDAALAEYTAVLDFADGGKHYRICVPRVNVTESAEIALKRGALAELPVTLKALTEAGQGIAYMLTDDPSWGAGS